MKTFILFLKWFFIPRGVTKVHPAMSVKYLGKVMPQVASAEHLMYSKTPGYKGAKCKVCGSDFWYYTGKGKSKVCTLWKCYKEYYLK